ncbi:MAG: O-antigen ligase family protein [Rhizobiaceae bacterium]
MTGLKHLRSAARLRPGTAASDNWWAGYMIAVPGIAGSLVSVLYFVAGVWAFICIAMGRFAFKIPVEARLFVYSGLGYALTLFIASVAADGAGGIAKGLAAGAAFAFVPALISRSQHSASGTAPDFMFRYAPAGAFLALAAALFQTAMGYWPIEGGAGNASVFGYVCAVSGALSLSNATSPDRTQRLFALAGFLFGMGALVLSRTRALYPVMVMAPMLFAFVAMRATTIVHRSHVIIGACAAVIFGGLSWRVLTREIDRTFSEYAQLSGDLVSNSLAMRLEIWRIAFGSIARAPFLGYGQVNKMTQVLRQLPENVSYVRLTHAHNIWVDSALAGGIPAVIFLTLLVFSPLFSVIYFRKRFDLDIRNVYSLLLIFVLSILNGMFNTIFTHDILTIMYIIPIIIIYGSLKTQ